MFRQYYYLTKPGIIRGNAITAAAGFLLAAQGNVDIGLLLAMLAGLSMIIGSACVFNNFIDRDIDSKMLRTKKRALAAGTIDNRNALVFAVALGIIGTIILVLYTNLMSAALGIFGFLAYVVFYGIAKRRSIYGTEIGSISGAIPPVVGYAASAGSLDLGALLIFIIVVCWQMPHFYAIAMYRLADYKSAGIPVLPAVAGMQTTKRRMLYYIVLFILASSALTILGYSGYFYLSVVLIFGLLWLRIGLAGRRIAEVSADTQWARRMFRFSLLVISGLSIGIAADSFIG